MIIDNNSRTYPLLPAAVAAGVLPLAAELPIWLIGGCLLILAAGQIRVFAGQAALSPYFRYALAIVGLLAAVSVRGGAVWMALLAVMLSLKPLEIETYRDRMVTILFGYFLIVTGVLFSQELGVSVYVTAAVLLNTLVLLQLNQPAAGLVSHFRLAVRIMFMALPFLVVLFLFFPRLPGPIWGVREPGSAVSGFSNRLAPGAFDELARDDSAAFRVEFDDSPPPRRQRYWRGLVLWESRGIRWERGGWLPLRTESPEGGGRIRYTITLEPHRQRWLFGLDLPAAIDVPAVFMSDHTIMAQYRVKKKVRYNLISVLTPAAVPIPEWEKRWATQLPEGNPRSRKLAEQWSAAAGRPADIPAAALDFFRREDFAYTLEPQPLEGLHRVDDFLFRSRRGYCEHFAGAFAFLMRAAGLPARVVMGYQGGEFNPLGDYLIVRQSDAHAWAEVWLPGKGWLRMDPTAAVVPARVEEGPEAALPPAERPGGGSWLRNLPAARYLTDLELGWDALSTYWNNWVISYTYRRQRLFFEILGLLSGSWRTPVRALVAAVGLVGLLALFLAVLPVARRRRSGLPLVRHYREFCRKLARLGLAREKGQGPRSYEEHLIAARPDLESEVRRIIDLYVRLRYARVPTDAEVKKLGRLVKRFRPRRRPPRVAEKSPDP